MFEMMASPPLKTASREEQLRAVDENGIMGALSWGDVFFDIDASRDGGQALRGGGGPDRRRPRDGAALLTPTIPSGANGPIIDQGYYETFNRDNVTFVDLRKGRRSARSPRRASAPSTAPTTST